jgi:hypothetical protein
MMNQDVLEQIFHLPIAERIEIIEKVSRSVREDLKETKINNIDFEKRNLAYKRLRGIAAVEGKTPPTDEEFREDYTNYLMEKYS